jgi:hypothetical protein
MGWSKVGEWLQENAGSGTALVGSLLTGNVPGAIAAGAALISGATGQTDPQKALQTLKTDTESMIKLKILALEEEKSIREHLQRMTEIELTDKQAEHQQAQETIRHGDSAEDPFVRRTRPAQAWLSLCAALGYVFITESPNFEILMLLLTLPLAYSGLRQVGKGIDALKK